VSQVKRTFAENYDKVKRTLREDYEIISWLLRIFLGGAFNIVLLNALLAFVKENISYDVHGTLYAGVLFSPEVLPQFVILLVAVCLSPFPISLILTKREPELKIVPPLYITLLSFVWIMIFWLSTFGTGEIFLVFLLGATLVGCGLVEDRLVTTILGMTAERDSIYFEHFRAYAEIDDVKARLAIPEIKDHLSLSDRVDGDSEKGYVFRTKRGYAFIIRISLTRDRQFADLTDVRIVYYEKARYNLRVSANFLEYAKDISLYLKDIFPNRERPIGVEVITSLTNTVHDSLKDSIIDEMYGYYTQYKRLSGWDILKIGALLVILVLTIVLFVYGLTLTVA
jgi:hypothetical protein